MPCAVNEIWSVARLRNDASTNLINRRTAHTWSHSQHSFTLRTQHKIMNFRELWCNLTDQKRACHIGVIPIHQTTHVDDHRITLTNNGACRTMMGFDRVLTRCHDRFITRTIGAVAAHFVLQFVSHISLRNLRRHCSFKHRLHIGQSQISCVRRQLHALNFGFCFDSTQLLYHAVSSNEQTITLRINHLEVEHCDFARIKAA